MRSSAVSLPARQSPGIASRRRRRTPRSGVAFARGSGVTLLRGEIGPDEFGERHP